MRKPSKEKLASVLPNDWTPSRREFELSGWKATKECFKSSSVCDSSYRCCDSTCRTSTHEAKHFELQDRPPNTDAPPEAHIDSASNTHAGTPGCPHPPSMVLRNSGSALQHASKFRKARNLARLVRKVVAERFWLDHEQECLVAKFKDLDQSTATLMAALLAVNLSQSSSEKLQDLDRIRAQCEADVEAINVQRQTVQAQSSRLEALEGRLSEKEHAILTVMSSFVGSDLSDTAGSEASSVQTPSDTPTLLLRYYQRTSDENVHIERLQQLNDKYWEQKTQRAFIAERGDLLPSTDEQFELEYNTEYDIIFADVLSAQADASKLKTECEAAGISTDTPVAPTADASWQPVIVEKIQSWLNDVPPESAGLDETATFPADESVTSGGLEESLRAESKWYARGTTQAEDLDCSASDILLHPNRKRTGSINKMSHVDTGDSCDEV
ncbi:hypothetical protein LTR56_011212 [Elasticomyces elasticus]|nr:hypothetical protein LTR56_011212 [Elasticomyces elasticus]KAK3650424.1 hypothetical protein LTR22_012514 [Elasticomyces elasticus]KAK4921843.1 hypothetical protein LTR49_010782 [Elasticomyces elasticus]